MGHGDIYGRDRLNSLLTKHQEIERRHIKLWVSSAGILNSIINAGTHVVSSEEVERTIAAAVVVKEVVAFVSIAKPLLSTPESHDLCCFWCG